MVLLLLRCFLYCHTNDFKHSKNRHFIRQSIINDRYDLGMEGTAPGLVPTVLSIGKILVALEENKERLHKTLKHTSLSNIKKHRKTLAAPHTRLRQRRRILKITFEPYPTVQNHGKDCKIHLPAFQLSSDYRYPTFIVVNVSQTQTQSSNTKPVSPIRNFFCSQSYLLKRKPKV